MAVINSARVARLQTAFEAKQAEVARWQGIIDSYKVQRSRGEPVTRAAQRTASSNLRARQRQLSSASRSLSYAKRGETSQRQRRYSETPRQDAQIQQRQSSTPFTPAVSSAGITSREWSSMNVASRRAVTQQADAGTLRRAGSGGMRTTRASVSGAMLNRPQSLTIVDRAGKPIKTYTATRERFEKDGQTFERRSLFSRDEREFYHDFGTGKKVKIQRELSGSFSGSPFLSSQIENVAGLGPRVDVQVTEQKDPTLFGSGKTVTETTIFPQTKAQAQLLTGSPTPVALTVTKTTPIPSRTDQFLIPKVEGTFIGGVALKAKEQGARLVSWAEPRLEASEDLLAARGSVPGTRGKFAYDSFTDVEPWKQQRYSEAAGFGGFLQGAGEMTLAQPSRVVVGGGIGVLFALGTRGASSGAAAITGTSLFANVGKQTLVRTSQLVTVGGYAATGLYATEVGYRFEQADGPAARGGVLGGEVPGLAGVFAGSTAVGTVITSVNQGRAKFTVGRALGEPLTEMGAKRLTVAGDALGGDVFVKGRSLKGVSVRSGGVSDTFGIRGLTEQQPIMGPEQTFPLGKAPKPSDYYGVSGGGSTGMKSGGVTQVSPISVSRVVTGGVAVRAGSPVVSSYNFPELGSGRTGRAGSFSGEATLYFSPVRAGVVRSTGGRGVAADTPFYRDFQSDLSFRRMLGDMEIVEVSPPARSPGLRSLPGSRPGRTDAASPATSLFSGGETIISGSRGSSSNMGGLARPGADVPGYDFTIGGQRMRLIFEDMMTQTKEGVSTGGKGGRGGTGSGPFIIEGIKIDGMGRTGGGSRSFSGTDFGMIGSISSGRGGVMPGVFSTGSVIGGRTVSTSALGFSSASTQAQGSVLRSLTDQAVRSDTVTDQVTDQIMDPVTIPKTTGGGDYGFDDWTLPKPPPPEVPLGGGFALPFGGGGRGRGRRGVPKATFRTAYNPSIAAKVFGIRGTRKQARRAARTGIGVRPII